MRYFMLGGVWISVFMLAGCSPTFNWRDVRIDQVPLTALFPCKPDRGTRALAMGGQDMTMSMWACDAGGVTFALAFVDVHETTQAEVVLDQWKAATLAGMHAQTTRELPVLVRGARSLPVPVQLEARGNRPHGGPVATQVAWFATGSRVFQAALYADTVDPAVAETFFDGIRLP